MLFIIFLRAANDDKTPLFFAKDHEQLLSRKQGYFTFQEVQSSRQYFVLDAPAGIHSSWYFL